MIITDEDRRRVGRLLNNYICKTGTCYDPVFDAEIRRLAPYWFVDTAVAENKKELLARGRAGEPKPRHHGTELSVTGSKLGTVLTNYIYESSGCYDPVFTAEIREAAPHWFVNTVAKNKETLLQMARAGEPRPNKETEKIGACLTSYISRSHGSYDPVFAAKIRRLAPHWFITEWRKRELLKMARTGKPRPHWATDLGRSLSRYMSAAKASTFDPVFAAEIRKLRPDWADKVAAKKKRILEMVEKPKSSNKMYHSFRSYITKNMKAYDPAFDAEIRKLHPDWFRRIN